MIYPGKLRKTGMHDICRVFLVCRGPVPLGN